MAANVTDDLTKFGPLPVPVPRLPFDVPTDLASSREFQKLVNDGLALLTAYPQFFMFDDLIIASGYKHLKLAIREWWSYLGDTYSLSLSGTGALDTRVIPLNKRCYQKYAKDRDGKPVLYEDPATHRLYRVRVVDHMRDDPRLYMAVGLPTRGFAHPSCAGGKLAEERGKLDKKQGDALNGQCEARVQDLSAKGLLGRAGHLQIERKP